MRMPELMCKGCEVENDIVGRDTEGMAFLKM